MIWRIFFSFLFFIFLFTWILWLFFSYKNNFFYVFLTHIASLNIEFMNISLKLQHFEHFSIWVLITCVKFKLLSLELHVLQFFLENSFDSLKSRKHLHAIRLDWKSCREWSECCCAVATVSVEKKRLSRFGVKLGKNYMEKTVEKHFILFKLFVQFWNYLKYQR